MNIQELKQREDYESILPPSVECLLARHFGCSYRVVNWDARGAQRWWLHSRLGGYSLMPVHRHVRSFLRDSLRYTPVRWRAVPQWVAVTKMSSRLGMRVLARPGFALEKPEPRAGACVVVPGNQRIRIFDFAERISTVCTKSGFSPAGMRREIAARRSGAPAPNVVAADADEGWLREQIMDAYPLVRCPPWFDRERLARRALEIVDEWSGDSQREVVTATWVDAVVSSIDAGRLVLEQREGGAAMGAVGDVVERLSARACESSHVTVAASHGDLQAGNILVEKRSRRVQVIDWEHFGERSRDFDPLVFGLGLRARRGLSARVQRFLHGPAAYGGVARSVWDAPCLASRVALVLLEDLAWTLAEAAAGPFSAVPAGARTLLSELARLSPRL